VPFADRAAAVTAVPAGLVVRDARPGDAAAVTGLMAGAFAVDPTAAQVAPWVQDPSLVRRVAERRQDGRLVATASARLGGQWFGGVAVPSAAISGVAVDITARGGGVGTALLHDVFAAARAAGAVLACLVPSTHAFYRRAGLGVAGRRPVFAVSTRELRSLPKTAAGLVYRAATPADLAEVSALTASRAALGNGGLGHPGDVGGALQFVAERGERIVGWCALGRLPARHGFTVVVHDLAAADPGTEMALWHDLVADPGAAQVHAMIPPGSLLEHHLPRLIRPVEDTTWMLGLLDVPAALAARGYPAGLRARLALDVKGHRHRYLLDVAQGGAQVVPVPADVPGAPDDRDVQAPDAGAQARGGDTGQGVTAAKSGPRAGPGSLSQVPLVRLAEPELASVYAGHLDPVGARQAGLLEGGDEGVQRLRTLFCGPTPVLHRLF